jgi:hypothetical protein
MRTHNHQVRTDVELMVSRSAFHRFHPSANMRIRDTYAIDTRRATGEAVLKPAQEDRGRSTPAHRADSQELPRDDSIGSSPYEKRGIRFQASTASQAASRLG